MRWRLLGTTVSCCHDAPHVDGPVRRGDAALMGARPPSVDRLARELAEVVDLPHALVVDIARSAIADSPDDAVAIAHGRAAEFAAALMRPVVNATGVLLHTNLGRAPLADSGHRATNLEFDLATGARGSRHDTVSALLRPLVGSEAAIVVNNNAAAVMLVVAALAEGRGVAVSRGECVEIGGGFRIPEVMERAGAHLIDVGTTNRTRINDYADAVAAHDVALMMRIHPSNFTVSGFTADVDVADLAALGVPVVCDVGSGLLDRDASFLGGCLQPLPAWIANEPAVRQSLADGAALVTFSGDKLLGGPQCGVIAGRADLVDLCARHPLMRALRPGEQTLAGVQQVLLAYLGRRVADDVPFWSMVCTPLDVLERRARAVAGQAATVCASQATVGAGSAPGTTLDSWAVTLPGDYAAALRAWPTPVIARVQHATTIIDMRSVHPDDDHIVAAAIAGVT